VARPPRLGAAVAACALLVAIALPAAAATITIVNRDGAREGLNDAEARCRSGATPRRSARGLL
jgi:hypothetical protein